MDFVYMDAYMHLGYNMAQANHIYMDHTDVN